MEMRRTDSQYRRRTLRAPESDDAKHCILFLALYLVPKIGRHYASSCIKGAMTSSSIVACKQVYIAWKAVTKSTGPLVSFIDWLPTMAVSTKLEELPEGIISLLDTDLYKLTMQCAILRYMPDIRT